ncbi:hypothetical protein HK096_009771, partial [Nowakowskiella sp. JEL0078]
MKPVALSILFSALLASVSAQKTCVLSSSSSDAIKTVINDCNNGGTIQINDLNVDGQLVLSGLNNVTLSIKGAVVFPKIPLLGFKYRSLWDYNKYLFDVQGNNVVIDGNNTGSLDGQGKYFWDLNWKYNDKPKLVRFRLNGASNVVKNMKFMNSPNWHITVIDSSN